ncbi:MAG: hypothetical protein J7L21_03890, partial [Sulfurimonas sp.]|nr:hypothetical protein [Sulfurimonas sp.]
PYQYVKNRVADGNIQELFNLAKEKGISAEQIKQTRKELSEYIGNAKEGSEWFTTGEANSKADEILATFLTNKKMALEGANSISKNTKASENVVKNIDDRTNGAISSFKDGSFSSTESRAMLESASKEVSAKYKDMKDTLFNLVGEDTPIMLGKNLEVVKGESVLTTLDKMGREFADDERTQGVLSSIASTIENRGTLNITDLLNIRKKLSKASRKADSSNKFLLDKMSHQVDEAIFGAVGKMTENPALAKEFREHFVDINKMYGDQKAVEKTKVYKAIMGESATDESVGKEMAKGTQILGDSFESVVRSIPKENRQAFENKAVSDFLESQTIELNGNIAFKGGMGEKIEVMLGKVHSEETRNALEAVKKMVDLFEADDVLLKKLGGAVTKGDSEGLATSIWGKIKYQTASKLFKFLTPVIKKGELARKDIMNRHLVEQLQKTRDTKSFIDSLETSKVINKHQKSELLKLSENIKNAREMQNNIIAKQEEVAEQLRKDEITQKQAEAELKRVEIEETADFYVKNPSTLDRSLVDYVQNNTNKVGGQYASDALTGLNRAIYENKPLNPHTVKQFVERLAELDEKDIYEFMTASKGKQRELKKRAEALKKIEAEEDAQRQMNDTLDENPKGETLTDDLTPEFKLNDKGELLDETGAVLFSKGIDNLSVATLAGVETDENGNVIGFSAENFLKGLIGYTALKKVGTSKAVQRVIKDNVKALAKETQAGAELVAESLNKKYPFLNINPKMVQDNLPVNGKGGVKVPKFFSQLEKVMKASKQANWNVEQLTGYLKKNGVKDEELKWSGFNDYVAGKKKVTSQEILDNTSMLELGTKTFSDDFDLSKIHFNKKDTGDYDLFHDGRRLEDTFGKAKNIWVDSRTDYKIIELENGNFMTVSANNKPTNRTIGSYAEAEGKQLDIIAGNHRADSPTKYKGYGTKDIESTGYKEDV